MLFHHALPLTNGTGAANLGGTDQWGNKIDVVLSGVVQNGEQTCFAVAVTVVDKNGVTVVNALKAWSPTIAGLKGEACKQQQRIAEMSQEEFVAETSKHNRIMLGSSDDFVLNTPRRRSKHNLGERPQYNLIDANSVSSSAFKIGSINSNTASSSSHSNTATQRVNMRSHHISALASSGLISNYGLEHVANFTDNGFRFDQCVNNSAPGELIYHQACTYEWDTCPVFNGNFSATAKGCQKWSQTAMTLAQPHSDREIIHGELYFTIEERTGPGADDYLTCDMWIASGDFVAKTMVLSSYSTQPDPYTGYRTNMTYSLMWGNATTPCVCTSFEAEAVVGVNETVSIFPKSKEYCNPKGCAPWQPATPTPTAEPSPSPQPEKKKGMSGSTKIAIAAAAGGGALLLGGGAVVMFFKKKPAAETSSLIGTGKGTSYSALGN